MKKIILLGAMFISLCATSQISSNGLVAYYPFNGNANDASGNGNNGIVHGATLTTDRFGIANTAYSFDGLNDLINLGTDSTLKQTTMSISLWAKINSYTTNYNLYSSQPFIFTKNNYTGNGYYEAYEIGMIRSNNTLVGATTSSSANQIVTSTSNVANLNEWNHLVLKFNNDSTYLYVNGLLKSQVYKGFTSTYLSTDSVVLGYVGNQLAAGDFCWLNGCVDDIRIYDRLLNQAEVSSLYNESLCFTNITVTDTLLINTTITGFNPITYKNTIKIWPNPSNDHITIDNGNTSNLTGYQVKISNALGQQVFQSAINQPQFYIDMTTWGGNGIYFINIINAQGVTIETRKIILQ